MPPDTVQQAFDLATQHHRTGRLGEAEALYRQILSVQPNHGGAVQQLGLLALRFGRHDVAEQCIRRAIAICPWDVTAYVNLGVVLAAQGQWADAVAADRRAIALKPDFLEAHYNLGLNLAKSGQLAEAAASYRRALELRPDHAISWNNLGNVLAGQSLRDEAITAYQRAIACRPDYHEAYNNLGVLLTRVGQLDEATAVLQAALRLEPNLAEGYNNLGSLLKDQGRLAEAASAFRKAIECKPDYAETHSNLIYLAHFQADEDDTEISRAQERWNQQFGAPLGSSVPRHANDPDPGRPLRIGYISPDFRDHITGRYLLPLFRSHDRREFTILCYSGVIDEDAVTAEFRKHSDAWRSTVGIADDALAEMIRQDGVDILVDLTQHMGKNRLPAFARRPAPVQVSFAGYPESTGLEAIGGRIGDRYIESRIKDRKSETGADPRPPELVALLDSFWCYAADETELGVNKLPAQENGFVTFGCLNNFCKVNAPIVELWARVLAQIPDSRLLLLCGEGSHRQWALEVLARGGIEARRVEFVAMLPRVAYLQWYHRMDISLDPFPYNGHMTSCDALWMGVPVVSLVGERAISRAGLSEFSQLGLEELAAFSGDDYVRIAAALANDLPRLAELRTNLRGRMKTSPLMDAARFSRGIETVYRTMWRRWCAENPLPAP